LLLFLLENFPSDPLIVFLNEKKKLISCVLDSLVDMVTYRTKPALNKLVTLEISVSLKEIMFQNLDSC